MHKHTHDEHTHTHTCEMSHAYIPTRIHEQKHSMHPSRLSQNLAELEGMRQQQLRETNPGMKWDATQPYSPPQFPSTVLGSVPNRSKKTCTVITHGQKPSHTQPRTHKCAHQRLYIRAFSPDICPYIYAHPYPPSFMACIPPRTIIHFHAFIARLRS